MVIGFDTLGENPNSYTSALNYLIEFNKYFKKKKNCKILLFGSTKNKHFFEFNDNTIFINCYFSNENVILRILAQQILIPIFLKYYKANLHFSPLNSAPIFTNIPVILKINTLHHLYISNKNKNVTLMKRAINSLRSLYRYIFFDLSIKKAKIIISNTIYTKNQILKFYNIDSDKVINIYESYDFRFGSYDKNFSKNLVFEKFNINYDYILYPANFWEYKNHIGAIESFNVFLKKYRKDVKLLLVGRDEENIKSRLNNLTVKYDIYDMVKYLDFVNIDDIVHLLNSSSVLFFPSKMETFGKPIVEAMASRVPIVASNNSSFPEIISNKYFLCDPNDHELFADKLYESIFNDNKKTVQENYIKSKEFTYEKSFDKLYKVFKEKCQKK